MWDTEPRKVLVAVDSADCEASLQYAVAEAVRRGCGLHLVHVTRPALFHACALDDVCLVEDELRLAGHAELDEAAVRAQALVDEHAPGDDRLAVSTELTHGSVVASLQSLTRHAALLVMEHHGTGHAGESATLSVAAGAAAVSHCPVVAVPEGWRPRGPAEQEVLVGVEDLGQDALVMQAAVHEARRRAGRVRVVRVLTRGGGAPPVPAELTDREVPVEVVDASGTPAEELLRHAEAAGLIVVGRHHRRHVVGAALGRTARSLLRVSRVPVLVVDPVTGDSGAPRPSVHAQVGGRR